MLDRPRSRARFAFFGGAVLLLLGSFLIWASLMGHDNAGKWSYFSVLMLLGTCMLSQGIIIWTELRSGGPTQGTDRSMITIQAIVIACLGWLAMNVDTIQVIQITNGEVHFTHVPEEAAMGLFLLMLLSMYDILVRLRRGSERATLNTAPRSTGPDAGP